MVWPEIGVFAGLVLAAQGLGGWGGRLLRLNRQDQKAAPPGLLLSQGLGLTGLALLAGGLSLAGWLRPWPVAAVLVPLALAGAWFLFQDRSLKLGAGPLSGWEKLILAGIVFHQLVYLTQALLPPLEGEGLHYLFNLAREYGRDGQVLYQPDSLRLPAPEHGPFVQPGPALCPGRGRANS